MEQQLTDLEYSNTDATVEQVKAAICAAKVIMQRPLPLTQASPEIALVGYKEEATGRYVRLIALRHMTREEYESVKPGDLPRYRVYEEITADGQ